MAFGSSIQATFGADTAPLAKGAVDAENIVTGFGSKATAALGALGITLGAGAIAGFFKSVIEKGGALQDLSDRLGVGTDELQAFDFMVRQAGGSTEQANATWDKSRKALDSLAAGQDTAVKQFAALGLKASDFIGLNLPQSLEKITRAYAENADAAGTYDAITDILGTKSAPQLNTVLLKLAAEGFPAFVGAAKAAGQVMESDAIARMDEFGDRIDALKGRLTSWGAVAFNVFGRITDGLGAVGAMALNAFDGLETSINRTDFVAEKADAAVKKILPALTQTTEQLKAQKDIAEQRAKWDEMIAKAALDQLEPAGKLLELKRRIQEQADLAVKAGSDELEYQKAMNKGAEYALEYRKLDTAERKKVTDAMRLDKETELEYARLVVKSAQGLTYEEGQRLEALKLQQAVQKNEYETKGLLSKGVENLTLADKARLAELFKQKDNLTEQIALKKKLTTATETQAVAEEKVTKFVREQWEISISTIRGKENKDLSDRELQEKINTLKSQLEKDKLSDPFGKYAYLSNTQRQDLSNAEFEVNRRASFRRSYAQEGEAAFTRYSAFDEQTLRNYIRPEDEKRAQQQADNINDIALRLKKIL